VALDHLIGTWSGEACRHIPDASPYDVLDLRFAGRAPDNRWNAAGEPTFYLASDVGVAIAEFARHFEHERTGAIGRGAVSRRVYTMRVEVGSLLDLREPRTWRELSLDNAPYCFLEKGLARAVAQFIRRVTPAEAILVPSMAFLEDADRWVIALFLEKLPADPRRFLTSVTPGPVFRVDP
jgi:RES domain-containing protein